VKYRKPSDRVDAKQYIYLNIPKNMDSCFYKLEFLESKENDKGEKLVLVWKVLETDTNVEVGSEISQMLNPNQEFAETYFWTELFNTVIAARGKKPSDKRRAKLKPKHENILDKALKNTLIEKGTTVQVSYERFEKKGKSRTAQDWQPYSPTEDAED